MEQWRNILHDSPDRQAKFFVLICGLCYQVCSCSNLQRDPGGQDNTPAEIWSPAMAAMLQTSCARPKRRALVVLEEESPSGLCQSCLRKMDSQPRPGRTGTASGSSISDNKSTASVNEFLALDDEPIEGETDVNWAPEDLPTLAEVESALCQAPSRKTAGLDNLPGELLRSGPAAMARIAQPLMLKATAMAGFCQPV